MTRNSTYKPVEQSLMQSFSKSVKFLCAVLACLFFTNQVHAQALNPELRISVREDNNAAYIFHTALPAISHGFNIYRKTEAEKEFIKINQEPIRGVSSGPEMRAYLGTLYDDIERITDQSSENETLAKIRSDVRTANLLTFTYPKMAEALGRLFIDTEAPTNELVTYRLEFVDALDNPTGLTLEKSEILLPQTPLPPIYLRAENEDKRVTLYWQYPLLSDNTDDKVIQFLVYRIDPATNQHEQVNTKVILKNNALFEYSYSFTINSTGQTEQFYVKAVDISGQHSESSEILHFETIDNIPPNAVLAVDTQILSGRRVQVQWQASTDTEIHGFNLYRSPSLSDKSSYVRLNNQVLSKFQTTFSDTLLSNSSDQLFYYRVTALDSDGNEGPYSVAALALLQDESPPRSPTRLSAEYKDGVVELTWDQSDFQEDFASFIILRHIDDPHGPLLPSRINQESLYETSFTDPGIAGSGFNEGATYRYEVLSTDHAGNQSLSASTEIKIPDMTSPAPPNGLQVLIDNSSRIAVYWNPSASSDVMSYLVYRRKMGSTRIDVAPISDRRLRYHDTTVIPGTSYEYWVSAADYAGNESLPSEPVTILMRDTIAPRYVRNVQAVPASETETVIRWEPVPSSDLAGYKVYRSASMTGEFEPLSDQVIKTTQWVDQNATGNAWYKIFAVDTSGNMSPPSSPTRVFTPIGTNN